MRRYFGNRKFYGARKGPLFTTFTPTGGNVGYGAPPVVRKHGNLSRHASTYKYNRIVQNRRRKRDMLEGNK